MHDNRLIIVNQFGALAMEYSSDFEKKMIQEGYENPFLRKQRQAQDALKNLNQNILTDKREWLIKKPLPVDTEEKQPQVMTSGLKYISQDEYIKRRDEYVTRRLYEKFGLTDDLIARIKYLKLEYMLEELKPCLAGDRQCTFLCPHYPCGEEFAENV